MPNARVRFTRGFVNRLQATIRDVSIPVTHKHLQDTGRLDAFRLAWKPGMPNPPHVFWDSDVAKWIETVAYAIEVGGPGETTASLERLLDEMVALVVSAQQPDGYLNTHFTVVEPANRWTNLRDQHELYCAGHLMEAAVAHHRATGKREFLDAMCRYADLIDATFGREPGKKRGYPGHQEIELALVKLYRATGNARYRDLAAYFIDERGTFPYYFEVEAAARGEPPVPVTRAFVEREYRQSHVPPREQEEAVGHAVRAQYMYAGMVDVARETGDAGLMAACRTLWNDVHLKKLYVTGGTGARREGEAFGLPYELPNDTAYAETCAAIANFFWNHRMLLVDGDATHADAMEQAFYNGIASGMSLSGDAFFYVNPLAANLHERTHERSPWFGCSCCPNNLTRLVMSMGEYMYSTSPGTLHVHLFAASEATATVDGKDVSIVQETSYPWDGNVRLVVTPAAGSPPLAARVRVPGWCTGASFLVNGAPVQPRIDKGHACIDGIAGLTTIDVDMPMPVRLVHAHPVVSACQGRAAIARGPVVYCLEEIDNGLDLDAFVIPNEPDFTATFDEALLGGMVVIDGAAFKQDGTGWDGKLYQETRGAVSHASITAVPYHAWGNRQSKGAMLTWIRHAPASPATPARFVS